MMSPSRSPPADFPSDKGSSEGALSDAESNISKEFSDAQPTDPQNDGLRSYDPPLRIRRLPSPAPSAALNANIGRGIESARNLILVEDIKKPQIHRSNRTMNGAVYSLEQSSNGSAALESLQTTAVDLKAVDKELGKQGLEKVAVVTAHGQEKDRVLKLSPAKIYELTSTPSSLPLRVSLSTTQSPLDAEDHVEKTHDNLPMLNSTEYQRDSVSNETSQNESRPGSIIVTPFSDTEDSQVTPFSLSAGRLDYVSRPNFKSPTVSTHPKKRRNLSSKSNGSKQYPAASSSTAPSKFSSSTPPPLQLPEANSKIQIASTIESIPSPMPQSIPMPPLSLPTYLQLELSSSRPSPLYIHRSATSDFPYESSQVKIERLQNFLLLPFQLEQVLWFGALACLDAWLFSFTILPLRFVKALSILIYSWGCNLLIEARLLGAFIYSGTGRMWRRRRRRDSTHLSAPDPAGTEPQRKQFSTKEPVSTPIRVPSRSEKLKASRSHSHSESDRKKNSSHSKKHDRPKSAPSTLLPDHKADILKGFLILISCTILMHFDASRMYHGIRGQAAIKLYVIYNVLEVCDRLFSALGQDVLECLFSKETLERKPDGRSKVLRPLWLFVLALFYNLVHATSLFYQVITLNVAVNSYSNALLTLLMSNQFVEIKSTVFKKFEKENLFQLTCADVVERFQLWLMLTIIASRNIIETGGLSLGSGGSGSGGPNAGLAAPGSSILPASLKMLPEWTEQVIGPFLLVLGSEMLVDWIKHAYITKFNMTKPAIYGRFLDILAKDYYSNAFADQNLTRRLGLPVIPLASLFIRASVQTYHMFLATNMPLPVLSPATSLSVDSATTSNPATTAALQHIDHIVRRALGRSTFGVGAASSPVVSASGRWTTDDMIAFGTMVVFFSVLFLVLLAFKLVLGMCLLSFARQRYKGMKERENISVHADGKRVGGWGVVEVGEDKRRWIYRDDPDGARQLREREEAIKAAAARGDSGFEAVTRYSMVAKRIW